MAKSSTGSVRRRARLCAAETSVSRRSKATTGRPNAIYSIVLFMVDTSFSGFFGSGHRPTSAVERRAATSSSGSRPGMSRKSSDPEFARQCFEVVVGLARTNESETQSWRPERVDYVVHHPYGQVDTVLGAHDPEVHREMFAASEEPSVGRLCLESLRIWTGAHHRHVLAALGAPSHGDATVRVVGRNDMIGTAESAPFEDADGPVEDRSVVIEFRFVQLGTEIVVIEDEADPEHLEDQGNRPKDVRRVTGLQDVESDDGERRSVTSRAVATNECRYSPKNAAAP